MTDSTLIRTPDQITSAWLAAVLERPGVRILATEPIGIGQMSQTRRIRFIEDGGLEETLVVKLACDDEGLRRTAVTTGAYSREICFYNELAPMMGAAVPHCLFATFDAAEGWFTLLLEDVAPATRGDPAAGCTLDQARLVMLALARVHAPVLNHHQIIVQSFLNHPNPRDQDLLTRIQPAFVKRHAAQLKPEHLTVLERFVPVLDRWAVDISPPLGLVQGDVRPDNLLFAHDSCTIVDWQTVSWGPPMTDVAYFLGAGLDLDLRRAHESDLVRTYHSELIRLGITALRWEAAWDGYRRAAFFGLATAVAASGVDETEDGDARSLAWFVRCAQQVLDLDAMALLPQPGEGPAPALRPDPVDEGCHIPASEPLWNESYYADAVSDDHSLGVYTRIGLLPNRNEALMTFAICGPGRPSYVINRTVPLPPADARRLAVDTPGLRFDQVCEEPLQRFRVTMRGLAPVYDHPAGPLRGDQVPEVEIAFDLVWETDGTPYAWRGATRYEIPCRINGTVSIAGEEIAFAGPGQRDHSWGSRDWWVADWMWNAVHLDDGTRIHQVGSPLRPGSGVGYVQKDGVVTEISTLLMDAEVTPDGVTTSCVLTSGDLVMQVEPTAWGSLRFVSPDDRVTFFTRAMCRVTTNDGRTGAGWIEWNAVQR